jgi:hypothetical protein
VPIDRTVMRPSGAILPVPSPRRRRLPRWSLTTRLGGTCSPVSAVPSVTRRVLALLAFCADGERTGNECVAHSRLSQGYISAHLACLVNCGLN